MANRQLAVMRIISKKFVPIPKIAEEVEASEKTIDRDLLDLSGDYDIETKKGRYGGVRMNPAAVVGQQYLTKTELAYIADAVSEKEDGDSEIRASVLKKINPDYESEK